MHNSDRVLPQETKAASVQTEKPQAISAFWTLGEALRTSHLGVPNTLEQVLRYGRIHSADQIRADLERTARTALDPLCARFGKGRVSSGYRCPELNRLVGGAANSAHTVGLAFDWIPNVEIRECVAWALREGLPFDRLIVEVRGGSRWLHVQAPEAGPGEPQRLVYSSPKSGLYAKLTAAQVAALTA
jgi:hypothetical protein